MARISHTKQSESKSSNPTTKYLEWKSTTKSFQYYDKIQGKNLKLDIPLKFVFLNHYHTVKGWHDASQSGIYSNEVFYIGSEPITVRSFKGGIISEGLYKEIKPTIVSSGGKYHRSVYVMLEDGSIANLSFKGAVVKEWSDFHDLNKNLLDNQWVEIKSSKDQKKGSIKYTTPEFSMGDVLKDKESSMADDSAYALKSYLDEYFNNSVVEDTKVEIDF